MEHQNLVSSKLLPLRDHVSRVGPLSEQRRARRSGYKKKDPQKSYYSKLVSYANDSLLLQRKRKEPIMIVLLNSVSILQNEWSDRFPCKVMCI